MAGIAGRRSCADAAVVLAIDAARATEAAKIGLDLRRIELDG
jgi:hypothetical protein